MGVRPRSCIGGAWRGGNRLVTDLGPLEPGAHRDAARGGQLPVARPHRLEGRIAARPQDEAPPHPWRNSRAISTRSETALRSAGSGSPRYEKRFWILMCGTSQSISADAAMTRRIWPNAALRLRDAHGGVDRVPDRAAGRQPERLQPGQRSRPHRSHVEPLPSEGVAAEDAQHPARPREAGTYLASADGRAS